MLVISLLYLAFIVCYLVGGQWKKQIRRYGDPLLLLSSSFYYQKKHGVKYNLKKLSFLLLIVFLSMGYGEDSRLHRVTGKIDWLTRIIYGVLLSTPFVIIRPELWYVYVLVLPICYLIRAGSLGKIGKYDILVEDIIRAVGLCVCSHICLV